MNIKHYKLLHYALVILLMIAPLRGIAAAPCDMEGMNVSPENTDVIAGISGAVAMAHDMSAMLANDSSQTGMMNGYNCCDDISINCSAACDLGISVSLVFQETPYSPVYKNSSKVTSVSSEILFRELTPPSRPPENFHS